MCSPPDWHPELVEIRAPLIELDDHTCYVPWNGPNGELGYRCQHRDGREVFIYFNPSDHVGDDVPNVFVYMGEHGDPVNDSPIHHYVIEWPGAPDA